MTGVEAGKSLLVEYENAEFGDARLNGRLAQVVSALAKNPAASFPQAMSTEAEVEGFYRFVRNKKVTLAATLNPHLRQTAKRMSARDEVLVVHDTSEFRFKGEVEREGLGRLGKAGQGFLAHVSLAVAADGSREPLGVVALQTTLRSGTSVSQRLRRGELTQSQARIAEGRESERWSLGVAACAQAVDDAASLIHVMDSEGDNYALMSEMAAAGHKFIIRLGQDRLVEDEEFSKIRDLLAAKPGPTHARRTVRVSRRKAPIAQKDRRRNAREERDAELTISATSVELRRPQSASRKLPGSLSVRVVYVRELDPPADHDPVEWILFTSNEVDTTESVLRVVDHYRARWLIEEFFKAMKTGCAIEKRQLETWDTIQVALGLFIPMAWSLLRLRFLSRATPDAPASAVLTPTQVAVLEHHPTLKLPPAPTVKDALFAVARLGGHLRSNGDPGWLVLGRGLDELLVLEQGYRIALGKYDQS